MNDTKNSQICGEIGEMVGREAACRQPVTDCHGLNAAAMREALVMVKRLFDGRLMWQTDIRKAHEAVNAALAKPPRNCDVGTADEQEKRFNSFCKTHLSGTRSICSAQCPCVGCRSMFHCLTKWEQMPYEEGVEK